MTLPPETPVGWPPPEGRFLFGVEVSGENVPAGSKRGTTARYKNERGKWRVSTWFDRQGHQHAKVNVSDVNSRRLKKRAKEIQEQVVEAAQLMAFEMPGRDVPLAASCIFYRPRRKGHYGSGRNERVLKDSAPAFPIAPPDATKLWRGFEDALTGVVWPDDSRVVRQLIQEEFVERWEEPLTRFCLWRLPATVAEARIFEREEQLFDVSEETAAELSESLTLPSRR